MDLVKLTDSMERFGKLIPATILGVSEEDAKWKPESGNWSILEIVCHLVDEEVDDFRKRVQLTLEDPTQAWPPIDPEGVVTERNYNEQNLMERAARFFGERQESVAWLRSLENPNWENAYEHPELGPVSAGTLMASWAAHDHLHLRQISKRLFEMNVRDGGKYSTIYAGAWTA